MPQPVPPNADLNAVFERFKNSVRVKSKKAPNINVPIGTRAMTPEDLAENLLAVYSNVERQIPDENIRSLLVKTTMGKPIKIR